MKALVALHQIAAVDEHNTSGYENLLKHAQNCLFFFFGLYQCGICKRCSEGSV